MAEKEVLNIINSTKRSIEIAKTGDDLLGPLKELPGLWSNKPNLNGRGWNMIALPFISSGSALDYRVLVNQYNEELNFTTVDKGVPNRGIVRGQTGNKENRNQKIITLDYEQKIEQIAAEDNPRSSANGNEDLAGGPGLAIHHEPGLWLNMINFQTNKRNIARLGTIPHGDSVLALGTSEEFQGGPSIPDIDVLPIGATKNINSPYLSPYKHYRDNPFMGLFNVLEPHSLLKAATPSNVVKTTKLEVSTKIETGGIVNIPFIVKHANATEMDSTFWIMELEEEDGQGNPRFIMQYMQVVMLDFFDRFDGEPGLIKWPHVSFNTMQREKINQ